MSNQPGIKMNFCNFKGCYAIAGEHGWCGVHDRTQEHYESLCWRCSKPQEYYASPCQCGAINPNFDFAGALAQQKL